jgi:hypothetical protein
MLEIHHRHLEERLAERRRLAHHNFAKGYLEFRVDIKARISGSHITHLLTRKSQIANRKLPA